MWKRSSLSPRSLMPAGLRSLSDGSRTPWRSGTRLVDGPDEVHVLAGDDLCVDLVVVPAHRVELVPAEDTPRGDLGTVLVQPRFARDAPLLRLCLTARADCTTRGRRDRSSRSECRRDAVPGDLSPALGGWARRRRAACQRQVRPHRDVRPRPARPHRAQSLAAPELAGPTHRHSHTTAKRLTPKTSRASWVIMTRGPRLGPGPERTRAQPTARCAPPRPTPGSDGPAEAPCS